MQVSSYILCSTYVHTSDKQITSNSYFVCTQIIHIKQSTVPEFAFRHNIFNIIISMISTKTNKLLPKFFSFINLRIRHTRTNTARKQYTLYIHLHNNKKIENYYKKFSCLAIKLYNTS